jgi:predicted RecA/RadA family phage recombinase
MAKNTRYDSDSTHRQVHVESESEIESGDPVLVGKLPGVALIDAIEEGEYDEVTIDTAGVYMLAVGTKEEKVEYGAPVYFKEGAVVSKGTDMFGYALGEAKKEEKEGEVEAVRMPVHIGW